MALDRELVARVRRLDQYDLRRLMILANGLLLHADGEDPTPAGGTEVAGERVTYRQEQVRCGKAGCTRCPHGPYWYAYWKQDGRTRSQYIGRHLAGQPLERVRPGSPPGPRPPAPGRKGARDGPGDHDGPGGPVHPA